MKKFVQGKSCQTITEGFVERQLKKLEEFDKVQGEKDTSRLRNALTFIKMRELFAKHDYRTIQLRLAEADYYDMPLEKRGEFLKTPVETLCKTMVMENTAYASEYAGDYYPKYICTIVQYVASLNSDKMMKAVRDYQHANCPDKKAPRSAFNFRVLEEAQSDEFSGYGHNGVTPFFFAKPLPIFLSKAIEELGHGYLWLGGGDTDIKLRIAISELVSKSETPVIIADLSNSKKTALAGDEN